MLDKEENVDNSIMVISGPSLLMNLTEKTETEKRKTTTGKNKEYSHNRVWKGVEQPWPL
jgi:hypothetical protein